MNCELWLWHIWNGTAGIQCSSIEMDIILKYLYGYHEQQELLHQGIPVAEASSCANKPIRSELKKEDRLRDQFPLHKLLVLELCRHNPRQML